MGNLLGLEVPLLCLSQTIVTKIKLNIAEDITAQGLYEYGAMCPEIIHKTISEIKR